MSMTKYDDDKYVVLDREVDQIRQSVEMYIGRRFTSGALHLCKEIFNNALDECLNENSPADKIEVLFDESTREFIVSDNGRGIPFDIMVTVCTKKHSSTKFDKTKANQFNAGLNGVGITVTMALSDYFSLTSYRGDEYKIIEFFDGELVEHEPVKCKKPRFGTIVKFIPSEKYLGKIDLTVDIIETYFRNMSYILPTGISLKFSGKSKDGLSDVNRLYKPEGLGSNVEFLSQTLEFKPVEVESIGDGIEMSMAFSYDKTLDDTIISSFCNYVVTTEGGYHEIACQRAICEYFSKEAKKMDPNHKYEVSFDDCKKGLIFAVNCKHHNPMYEGQHKSKVGNKEIQVEGKPMIYKALVDYFNSNNSLLKKIISYLRQIAKIRLEAHKIKEIDTKKPSSFLDDAEIKSFFNVSDRNYNGYKELFIAEGDSAAGALLNSRNAKYQAVFGLIGVVDNTYGISSAQVLQKQTFRNLVKVLGCGIGADFNINKLKWNKIIICTDKDTDGDFITSLLCTFFATHLPGIINDGRLYKAIPPLYLLDKKTIKKYNMKTDYLFDKKEMDNIFFNIIANNIDVCLCNDEDLSGQVLLKKKELVDVLFQTKNYISELTNLVKRSGGIPIIVEYACWYLIKYGHDKKKFKCAIEKQFPEMIYDMREESLDGSYNGEHFTLIIDKLFVKMAKRFIKILAEKTPSFYVIYKNKKDNYNPELVTFGTFLYAMRNQYDIELEQRFKGLGEADPSILFISTMNPKIRKLYKINMTDVKKTMEIVRLLHGKDAQMIEERRKMLEDLDITYDDIDS